MIIDHNHPLYVEKRKHQFDKHNGAYYYSKDIVKYIIPLVKTDRTWVTIRIPEATEDLTHSIVFIHNNRNPNYYEYLKKFDDVICVCSTRHTLDNMIYFGKPLYLPLSIDVKSVKRYYIEDKDKEEAFAGRRMKITNRVPSTADILTDMNQTQLIKAMAHYKKIYAVGRTAVQARALGCEIGFYDTLYPDVNYWKVIDCKDAAKMLQEELNKIDG